MFPSDASQQVCCVVVDPGDVDGDGVADMLLGGSMLTPHGQYQVFERIYSGVTGSEVLTFTESTPNWGVGPAEVAGDVNADGFIDIVIGSPSVGLTGKTQVFSGKDASELLSWVGQTPAGGFGISVCGAGDIDQDGFADVVAGNTGSFLQGDYGHATVLSGVDGHLIYLFIATPQDSGMGWVVRAGDLSGDGVSEIILGAPGAQNAQGQLTGAILVHDGPTGNLIYRKEGQPGGGFAGPIRVTDDLDGDGLFDLLVADKGDDTAGLDFGAVYRISGITGATLGGVFGEQTFTDFGDLDVTDDLDGDGVRDFLVSGRLVDNPVEDAGLLRAYSGKDGSTLFTMRGSFKGEQVGQARGGLGDLNGDGIGEFAVGSRYPESLPQNSKITIYSGRCSYLRSYGSSCPGTGGIAPVLAAEDHCYTTGDPVEIRIENALGGAQALLIFGADRAAIPLSGCFLNVWPLLPFSVPLQLGPGGPGQGSATLGAAWPAGLPSGKLTMQAIVLDPAAPAGAVGTNGLELLVP